MEVGELVRYKSPRDRWNNWKDSCGIIIRCIPGTDKRKVVHWSSGMRSSYPQRELEVLNENR
jgi:hypothetical protein